MDTLPMSLNALIILPVGLGLLGFVEPCTIGGHLVFLDTQKGRAQRGRIKAVLVFLAARTLVTGLFGALVAMLGAALVSVQTGMWLVFGTLYLLVGLAFIAGRAGLVKQRIRLAPEAWKRAQNPLVLGLAFGLNIPACAAPILFGLLGLAATTGTILGGFVMMALFGLALSAPLVVFAALPRLSGLLERLAARLRNMRWVLGAVFVVLGLWSIWFGLNVDPKDWAGT